MSLTYEFVIEKRAHQVEHSAHHIAVQSACALCGPIRSHSIDRLQ